jgi:small subunit ribosomal protein S1
MEDKNQAVEHPAPAADPAPETNLDQAPSAVAEQGDQNAAATNDTESSAAPNDGQPSNFDAAPRKADEPAPEAEATDADQAGAPADEPAPQAEATDADQAGAPADEPAPQAEATDADQAGSPAAESSIEGKSDDEITMEDVLAASDEQLARKPVHRGMIVNGEIIMLTQDGIVVDVGAKIEGLLPYNQLFEHDSNQQEAAQYYKPGDSILVYVVRSDVPNNTIVLSKRRADAERAWNLLQEIHEKEKAVEVEIVEKVRGGLVANLGVRAFLPASQVDVRRVNDLSPYVGQRMKVRIIELNRRRNRVIISRRAILEEELAGQKSETLKQLEPGFRTEGEVVEITDFGVFVNLGGIDGLVHRSELTHGRFNHPRDVLKVGDKVKVEVLDMDLERERINLSMKKLMSNPWENVLANYHIGQKVSGKVTNLTPFGAFVEIEPGLEGLIHVSEMSWTKRVRHPKEIVTDGDDVEAMILKIDTQQQRISLGLRQTQPDPWSSLPDRYPPGTEVTGPITGITDFGVFMEIEEGIEGLVHISELAHEHIEDINEHFKRGDEVTAVILNIDPVEQRASLSRKRLLPFTAGAGGYDEVGTGAPAARGGAPAGRRGGRRAGRRGAGIDYDYSYAADSASQKTTTKLGDVYADLFAQFGLSETKERETGEATVDGAADTAAPEATATEALPAPGSSAEPTTEPTTEPAAEATTDTPTEPAADADATDAAEPHRDAGVGSTAAAETAADAPASAEAGATAEAERSEESAESENAIDAAEAAALLTAAFREGRRPAQAVEPEAAEAEPEASAKAEAPTEAEAPAEAEASAADAADADSDAADTDADTDAATDLDTSTAETDDEDEPHRSG